MASLTHPTSNGVVTRLIPFLKWSLQPGASDFCSHYLWLPYIQHWEIRYWCDGFWGPRGKHRRLQWWCPLCWFSSASSRSSTGSVGICHDAPTVNKWSSTFQPGIAPYSWVLRAFLLKKMWSSLSLKAAVSSKPSTVGGIWTATKKGQTLWFLCQHPPLGSSLDLGKASLCMAQFAFGWRQWKQLSRHSPQHSVYTKAWSPLTRSLTLCDYLLLFTWPPIELLQCRHWE